MTVNPTKEEKKRKKKKKRGKTKAKMNPPSKRENGNSMAEE